MSAINLPDLFPAKRRWTALIGVLVTCGLLFQTFVVVGHSFPAPVVENEQSLLFALKQICRANGIEEKEGPTAPQNVRDPSCLVCQVSAMVALLPGNLEGLATQTHTQSLQFQNGEKITLTKAVLPLNARAPPTHLS